MSSDYTLNLRCIDDIDTKGNLTLNKIYQGKLPDENDVIHPRRLGTITLNILKFDNHNDAIKFYISINENITHNAEDIDKAKKYII